jgi:hypothetical protein
VKNSQKKERRKREEEKGESEGERRREAIRKTREKEEIRSFTEMPTLFRSSMRPPAAVRKYRIV